MKPPHEPDLRTKDAQKGKSKPKILRVCEEVARIRGVNAVEMFDQSRGPIAVATARSFAMAACVSIGVPMCHVARAFGRDWHVVYQAEIVNAGKYRESEQFRAEFDALVRRVKSHE